jgi:excisionase family DNA binding protein
VEAKQPNLAAGLEDLRTLTIEEVAEVLGVHGETVRRWVREGHLRAARWGGRLHVTVKAVREFQEAREVYPPDPAEFIRRARRRRAAPPGGAARPAGLPVPEGVVGDFIRRAKRDGDRGGARNAAGSAAPSAGPGR